MTRPIRRRTSLARRPATARLCAVLVALHASGVLAADVRPAPAWSERRGMLDSVRWWIAPDRMAALRTMPAGGFTAKVDWGVPTGSDDGVTADERDVLRAATAHALHGSPADARPPLDAAYRLVARVTEVWRPNRLLNALIVALPAPSVPFFTQGGAASEVELVDAASGQPVAGFVCRRYAGMLQFLNAFGRIGHAQTALEDCAGLFLATLRDGGLPAPGLTELASTGDSGSASDRHDMAARAN